MPASPEDLLRMYRTMVLVRQAEERLVRLFGEGRMPGFIHSYIGEEATAVGVCSALRSDDYLTSTHRRHGHVLAKGGDPARFFAELYGKESGYCRGKGGSMHVTDLDLGILGANGIVGAGIPIAAGAALASRMRGTDQVAVAFLGDGATDIGVFHEALNMASLWEVPAVFVCENNGYADFMAQSVHQKIERVSERAAAVEQWKRRDPLRIVEERLRAAGSLDDAARAAIWQDTTRVIDDAVAAAEAAPLPSPEQALEDVYAGAVEAGWS